MRDKNKNVQVIFERDRTNKETKINVLDNNPLNYDIAGTRIKELPNEYIKKRNEALKIIDGTEKKNCEADKIIDENIPDFTISDIRTRNLVNYDMAEILGIAVNKVLEGLNK